MFISPQTLKIRLGHGKSPLILDVREVDEFQNWHIPGAVNHPLSQILSGNVSFPINKDIVTICQHGVRSARVAQILRAQGYTVSTLKGGMVEWNSVYDVVEIAHNVIQLRRVGKGCLSHVLIAQKKAWVVDPTIDVNLYLEETAKRRLKLGGVLDTHSHADHVSGGRLLSQKAKVKYYAPVEVGPDVRDPQELTFLKVLKTPGHTPGSVSYLFGNFLLTGDTLFVESVGRPDLGQDPKKNGEKLFMTLQTLLKTLPGDTTILPAHVGENVTLNWGQAVSATLTELKRSLSALSYTKEEFIAWISKISVPTPPHFKTIKAINSSQVPEPSLSDIRELEAGPNRCAVL